MVFILKILYEKMNPLLKSAISSIPSGSTLLVARQAVQVYADEMYRREDAVSLAYLETYLTNYCDFKQHRTTNLFKTILKLNGGNISQFKDYLTTKQYTDLFNGKCDDDMLENMGKMVTDLEVYYH
jgi:hypothetical protein